MAMIGLPSRQQADEQHVESYRASHVMLFGAVVPRVHTCIYILLFQSRIVHRFDFLQEVDFGQKCILTIATVLVMPDDADRTRSLVSNTGMMMWSALKANKVSSSLFLRICIICISYPFPLSITSLAPEHIISL